MSGSALLSAFVTFVNLFGSIGFLCIFIFGPKLANSFIFDSPQPPKCYELDLENCFREAFLSAIHPPMKKRDLNFVHGSSNSTATFDRRKNARALQICHDVRRFANCFNYPGCAEQQSAMIASVQYHMVFGKKLPIHVFIAYKGYGRELCDYACRKESISSCRRSMPPAHQQSEQDYLLDASTAVEQMIPGNEFNEHCDRFRSALIHILRLRTQHCGEVAKCTCNEQSIQTGTSLCNLNCEQMLNLDLHSLATRSASSGQQNHLLTLLTTAILALSPTLCSIA
ncbi:hypothetical protein WR25_08505 [Diploscapter pachys]|uniref:Uncharacterized protein n=1 Tax=Diploscapter pachys TaxID=2018661 RepID=A0A2A2LFK0_9BILA|nr:hypothetical protein WR25_08505 [Diploscapter pachys]